MVALPVLVVAKLALYEAMRTAMVTNTELGRRLGISEGAVRWLVDLDHRSHIGQVEAALAALGRRLVVVVLEIPPLRARGEDVMMLAEHFLRHYCLVHGVVPRRLGGTAQAWLRGYSWPGNVWELGHLLERVTLLSPETIIGPETLARLCLPPTVAATPAAAPTPGAGVLQEEAAQLRQVLEQTRGNIVQAARLLGLKRSTLRYA